MVMEKRRASNILVIFFALNTFCETYSQEIVKKCCPENQILDLKSLTCVSPHENMLNSNLTLLPSHVIDLKVSDFSKSLIKMNRREEDLKTGMGV